MKSSTGRGVLAYVLSTSVLAVGVAVASPAFAQDAATDPGDDTIIVTAQRRSERLQDVPASVTAVTGEALQSSGVTRFQDLGSVVAGVQISRSGTYTQPAIRGISTTFAGGGQETNVAIYIDGFYQSDQLTTNQDLVGLRSVQVLKGPQGTLYGRNATGGAILIETAKPGNDYELDASISYAEFNDLRAQAYVAIPIVQDLLSLGVSAYYRTSDGYFRDINNYAPGGATLNPGKAQAGDGKDVGGFRNRIIRTKLRFTPTADIALTLGYNYTWIDDPRPFAYGPVGAVTYGPALYPAFQLATKRDTTSLNYKPINRSWGDEYTLLGEFNLSEQISVVTHTSYLDKQDYQLYDFDTTPFDGFYGEQANHRKTFTQAVDFTYNPFEELSLLAGFFYYDDDFSTPFGDSTFRSQRVIGGVATPFVQRQLSELQFDTKAWAAYLDGTWEVSPGLFVTLGGRYAEDKKHVTRTDRYFFNGAVDTGLPFPGGVDSRSNGDKWTSFTTRAVVRYELDAGSSVYASFSQGFKSGTLGSNMPLNAIKPEKVNGYEVGYRSSRGSTFFGVSAFYYDYKNNQVAALDPNQPGLSTLVLNSGGSKIYGAEAQFSAEVLPRLNLRAGVSYVHGRYTDFDDANNTTLLNGFNRGVTGDWSGRRLVRSPDWSGNVGLDYTAPVGGGELKISGTGTFQSRYAPQNAGYQCAVVVVSGLSQCDPSVDYSNVRGRFEENGWVVVNGQISWTDPSEHYTITAFANNLLNERYKIISFGSSYATYEMYNEPQQFGAKLGVKF